MKRRGEVIQSGHFMISSVTEEQDDQEDISHDRDSPVLHEERLKLKRQGYDFSCADKEIKETYHFYTPKTSNKVAIDASLSRLFQCMSLAYRGGKVVSPKWKNFKGLKLSVKDKIRLNNAIWRTWHIQYVKRCRPLIQFATPFENECDYDSHSRPEAVVLEGKYWKRRIETVVAEYKKWRAFYTENMKIGNNQTYFLMPPNADIQFSPFKDMESAFHDQDYMSELGDMTTDTLLSSLITPFPFPDTREIAMKTTNSDMIQPGLLQLQPTLDDFNEIQLDSIHNWNQNPPAKKPALSVHNQQQQKQDLSMVCFQQSPSYLTNMSTQISPTNSKSNFCTTLNNPLTTTDPMLSSSVHATPPNPSCTFKQPSVVNCNSLLSNPPIKSHSNQTFANQPMMMDNKMLPGTVQQIVESDHLVYTTPLPHNHSYIQHDHTNQPTVQMMTTHVAQGMEQVEMGYSGLQPQLAKQGKYMMKSVPHIDPQQPNQFNLDPQMQQVANCQQMAPVSSDAIITRIDDVNSGMDAKRLKQLLVRKNPPSTSSQSSDLQTNKLKQTKRSQRRTKNNKIVEKNQVSFEDVRPAGQWPNTKMWTTPYPQPNTAFNSVNEMPMITEATPNPCSPIQNNDKDLKRGSGSFSTEQKRRFNIKIAFERLQASIPNLNSQPNAKNSKAAIMGKAALHIKSLQANQVKINEELLALRNEISILKESISDLQHQLPVTGVPVTQTASEDASLQLNLWINQQTRLNWKFYLFGAVIKPWFETYHQAVSTADKQTLPRSIILWTDEQCSLPQLRANIVNSLQMLSCNTFILTNPQHLQQQIEELVADSKQ